MTSSYPPVFTQQEPLPNDNGEFGGTGDDDDANEWKYTTTTFLQRAWMEELHTTVKGTIEQPTSVEPYDKLKTMLGEHCDRAYNHTCLWSFAAAFDIDMVHERMLTPRENGAIVYLCCADALEFDDLLWSLQFLDTAFNDDFKYPVVIFYTNFGEQQFNILRQASRSKITFERVIFSIPKTFTTRTAKWIGGYSIGWRHMANFFAMTMHNHPALKKYKWVWRLDSDSFLVGRVYTDPFHFMVSAGLKHAFMTTGTDETLFTQNLEQLLEQYVSAHKVNPTILQGQWGRMFFTTHGEITDLDWWRYNEDANKWLKTISASGGIYMHRWSDAVIRFLAIVLHMEMQHLLQIQFLPYWHQNFISLPQPLTSRTVWPASVVDTDNRPDGTHGDDNKKAHSS